MSSSNLCLVLWPSAPLTERLVRNAIDELDVNVDFVSSVPPLLADSRLIQWASYDHIDHELTHENHGQVLSSSYIFRKAIIRKHYLSRCLSSYITKYPLSPLKAAIPKTYEIDISFADELDELWADDLWELAEALVSSQSWWILKPGMSDRGMGIRLFNSKESLQEIFEEFELSDDEPEDDMDDVNATAVATSQLRHFVLQEYLPNPLLIDPSDAPIDGQPKPTQLKGHKFHLRAYCVASGSLQVYLYDRILSLFSSVPYISPVDASTIDLTAHLTNTSLQTHKGEENVRLFNELVGCRIFSPNGEETPEKLTQGDVTEVIRQMGEALGETFKAALANPVHFQPLPNAFELYGIDFLVVHSSKPNEPKLQVKLLEINAEPAIELTGPRLTWILEDLFISMGKVCVEPFLTRRVGEDESSHGAREREHHLIKVFDYGSGNFQNK